MHARRHNLLALAVGAILLPAVALADKPTGVGQGKPTATPPTVTHPAPAVDRAGDALERNPRAHTSVTREVGKRPQTSGDRNDSDDDDAAGGTGSGKSEDSAAQTNPGKGNWWSDIDGDSDDRISRAEAEGNAGLDSRFATVDTNGDGFVTRAEYKIYYQANAAQGAEHAQDHSAVVSADLWRRFDANGDGRLTAVEIDLDARLKADFGAIDANDDGFVSDDEYRAYYRTD